MTESFNQFACSWQKPLTKARQPTTQPLRGFALDANFLQIRKGLLRFERFLHVCSNHFCISDILHLTPRAALHLNTYPFAITKLTNVLFLWLSPGTGEVERKP